MYCYTNLSINFPSDRKITIMLHRRTHTNTRSHTYTQKQRCAICDLALWTHGAVCIDLLVRVAMQCNKCSSIASHPPPRTPPSAGRPSPAHGPGYRNMQNENTSTCTDHMNTGANTHTVMAGVCKCQKVLVRNARFTAQICHLALTQQKPIFESELFLFL